LLTAYDGVTQFFPAIVLSLVWRRTSKYGAAAGILVGVGLVLYLVVGGHDPLWGLNAGIVALAANTIVLVVISLLRPEPVGPEVAAEYAPERVAVETGSR
jgi:solute:Na+ symporter, SSS family